jgi:hypothetical protein
MDHMQYLLVRSHNPPPSSPPPDPTSSSSSADNNTDVFVSGHALMATCPPESHIRSHPEEPYPPQMPADIGMADLLKLLDLSNRLPLDPQGGEVTPVMAWAMVLRDRRVGVLGEVDVRGLRDELVGKVRCYG